MSQYIRHYPCPCCGAPLKITSSVQQHAMFKDQYARCDNALCGASFLLRTEIIKTLSQPSQLFTGNLPDTIDKDANLAPELAREFVMRPWQSTLNRDERLELCRDYLMEILSIDHYHAELVAARAIAYAESHHISDWHINLAQSDAHCLLLNEGQNTHVISTRELRDFVYSRLKVEL